MKRFAIENLRISNETDCICDCESFCNRKFTNFGKSNVQMLALLHDGSTSGNKEDAGGLAAMMVKAKAAAAMVVVRAAAASGEEEDGGCRSEVRR